MSKMLQTVEEYNHISNLGENYAVIEHEVYENNKLIKQMKGSTYIAFNVFLASIF